MMNNFILGRKLAKAIEEREKAIRNLKEITGRFNVEKKPLENGLENGKDGSHDNLRKVLAR